MDMYLDLSESQQLRNDFPSVYTGVGNLHSHSHQQSLQQQQVHHQQKFNGHGSANSQLSFSSDDYNHIMTSSIGSVLPSRDSVAGFMDNPGGLLDIGSMRNFFEPNASFRSHQQNVYQDVLSMPVQNSSTIRPEQANLSMDLLLPKPSSVQFQRPQSQPQPQTFPKPIQAIVSSNMRQSSPSSSRSDLFSMPDPFSEPINDDLFGDEQSLPSRTNKRKEITRKINPSPQIVISAPSTPAPSLLHQACYLYSTTLAVINSALGVDKENLRRRVPTSAPSSTTATTTTTTQDRNNNGSVSNKRQKRQEAFTLPLHIAVDRGGSLEVLRTLAEMAPDVIAMTDGPVCCNAIAAHLYKKNHNLGVISMLIKECAGTTASTSTTTNGEALKGVDRYKNTCLHVACAQGAPLEIVELIYTSYPDALKMKNFHFQCPLEVAQRTSICPLDVIDFLQELVSDALENSATHLVDSDDDV